MNSCRRWRLSFLLGNSTLIEPCQPVCDVMKQLYDEANHGKVMIAEAETQTSFFKCRYPTGDVAKGKPRALLMKKSQQLSGVSMIPACFSSPRTPLQKFSLSSCAPQHSRKISQGSLGRGRSGARKNVSSQR